MNSARSGIRTPETVAVPVPMVSWPRDGASALDGVQYAFPADPGTPPAQFAVRRALQRLAGHFPAEASVGGREDERSGRAQSGRLGGRRNAEEDEPDDQKDDQTERQDVLHRESEFFNERYRIDGV